MLLILGVLWLSISLWLAHRKGVMLETRFWSPRWPLLPRDEDPQWFYLNLSAAWLTLIVWLAVLTGVLVSEWGINLPDLGAF